MNNLVNRFRALIHHEAGPGVLLMIATVLALVVSNAGVAWYPALLETKAVAGVGAVVIDKPLLLWINDGLMAIFFLLVGLELKREVLWGELSEIRKVVLPLLAALGGLIVPAFIYFMLNKDDGLRLNGWAIPAATDIAFALGILALLGSRAPLALKILLTSVAVIDDLAAIVIIAIFYTHQLSMGALIGAACFLAILTILNRVGVRALGPYLVVGLALWICVLKSGVHATLAGVALAAFIPMGDRKNGPAGTLEHALHPWVVFAILPVFAFANAGVPLVGLSLEALMQPVPLGIALGLFVGKQIGVFGMSWLAVKTGLAKLPSGVSWMQIYGLAVLCGVGFTMSLFIGSLAFEGSRGFDYAVEARIGILAGSVLSGIFGAAILYYAGSKKKEA
jgi:NhaA family Na+:H+ antiporter